MLGAVIGDMVGSVYEFANTKRQDFPLFQGGSDYTDDSVMSMAVAQWLLTDVQHTEEELSAIMRGFSKEYPCPKGGYGSMFLGWLLDSEAKAYGSWGNGAAMRVSAVGWMFDTLEETERIAEISASVSHNHPEGIKGAQATAAAIFMARTGSTKAEIKTYITNRFGYDLDRMYESVHATYHWESSCQGTVPEAIIAFLASHDYESSIRMAVALGGDSDTLACINGGIAEAFYKEIPMEIRQSAIDRLPLEFVYILRGMQDRCPMLRYYDIQCFTPDYISRLEDNEIFVFGSNLHGFHSGGAAKTALDKFDAVWGQGTGLQGNSYAIPTMQGGIETIKPYVDEFIDFAEKHPELHFLVTRVGCGIAGFSDADIAPLFAEALNKRNISIPRSFYNVLVGKPNTPILNPQSQKVQNYKSLGRKKWCF